MTATLKTSSVGRQPEPDSPHVAPRFLLHGISWSTYEALLADLEHAHVFLTYDKGNLELMSPLPKHEREKKLLARLVETYTLERNIPIAGFGQTTWRIQAIEQGLEADECYYIRNEHVVHGRDDIAFPNDPPPDLAIEVDVTHNTLDKQSIYAALKIGELWNWENERLIVLRLQAKGEYLPSSASLNLPELPIAEIERFMRMRHGTGDTELIRLFSAWVRENLGA